MYYEVPLLPFNILVGIGQMGVNVRVSKMGLSAGVKTLRIYWIRLLRVGTPSFRFLVEMGARKKKKGFTLLYHIANNFLASLLTGNYYSHLLFEGFPL